MQWKKFILNTITKDVELVSSALMEAGITSFEVEDNKPLTEAEKEAMFIDILPEVSEDDHARIIFYMDMDSSEEEEKQVLDTLDEKLEELSVFIEKDKISIEKSSTKDVDWVNKWKEFFKPFSVDDILIKPSWEQVEDTKDYKMVIEIDPGTAFGTGLHETTQLCIRQLRKYITNETKLLDVGCGSGILSIIGKKLGAQEVFGIDVDEAAVLASYENTKMNHVEPIKYIQGNIIDEKEIKDQAGYECYDIVVANILADIIIPLSKVIAPHMKVGGLFITSGIIYNKEADVVKAIEENECLEVKEITRQKDWVNVTAVRVK